MAIVNVIGPYSTGYQGSAITTAAGMAGKGIVIGDGFVLTAAHVVYEWDRIQGTLPNIINNSSYNGKLHDFHNYKIAYTNAAAADVVTHSKC